MSGYDPDEWKAGDVAEVTDRFGRTGRGICNARGGWDFTQSGAGLFVYSGPREITEAHRLIVLDLSPHEVRRTLEALRHGRGYIAGLVADKLEAAAPDHMRILAETEVTR